VSFVPWQLYSAVKAALDKAISDEKDRLANGHWRSEGEARKHVGVIAGLDTAKALLAEEYGKLERLEEDERDE